MYNLSIEIIETLVVVVLFLLFRVVLRNMITKAGKKFDYQKSRVKTSKRVISTALFIIALAFILMIWGVDQSDLFFFISSALTVMGIALFAQWSILSNITSGLIIYLNHPVKIGDSITIIDRDYEIDGRIATIGLFFLTLETNKGDEITIPCNLFLHKMIRKNKSQDPDTQNTWMKSAGE